MIVRDVLMTAELRGQREAAEAADERLLKRERTAAKVAAAAAALLARNQAQARRRRGALERRLTRMATNQYQRRLTAIASKHLPVDIIVRFDRRRMARLNLLGQANASESRIVLRQPPTTLHHLKTFLHEVAHVELKHSAGGETVQTSWGRGWWNPQHEVEAETRAQEIMREHGLKITREGRDYLRDAETACKCRSSRSPLSPRGFSMNGKHEAYHIGDVEIAHATKNGKAEFRDD